ncbi:MAG: hypothetical protein AAB784_03110 [Patescibacteria group bacterium]
MDFKIEPLQKPNIIQLPPELPKQSIFSFLKNLIKTKYIIAGSGLLILIAFIFFFIVRGSFYESGLQFKIEGPTEVTSGELITYKIIYQNNNDIDLKDVKLNIIYPTDSIVIKDGNITDLSADTFNIDTIRKKEITEKEITTHIIGDRGNIKTLRATLTYKAGNLSSTFQKETTLASTITNLSVPITLVAPPTIISGQNMIYLIDYRNQSPQDLENLRFIVKFPPGFTPVKFTPQFSVKSTGQATWDISKLKRNDGSRITIDGKITGAERETKIISVILQKKITTPSGDIYINIQKSEASSVISTPLLSLTLRLNDSDDYVAHLGDILRYKLNFKNNSTEDIQGLNLSVKLDGSMYDFSTVRSDGFFDGRLNTIFWNVSTLPLLNILQANQSGTVEFEVRLKNSFSGNIGGNNSLIKASAHLETPNVPSNLDLDKLSADSDIITRVSTTPTFEQKIYINDQTFGSSGPYPPRVNQKTIFTTRWNLVNPSNDISQAKITATLAPGVIWENQTRVNGTSIQPIYNSKLNTVTWDLGTLPTGTGINFPIYEAFFQISITPSANQINQSVQLLRNVRFEGIDTFTKEKITRTIVDMTTSNVSDSTQGGSVQP